MPIYAYRCESCGYEKDVLQKVSDSPLTVCPACNAETLRKQVTAAGFQLKGSGWYATDFRGGGKPKAADESGGQAVEPGKTESAPAADKPAEKAAAPTPAAAPAESAAKPTPPAAGAGS